MLARRISDTFHKYCKHQKFILKKMAVQTALYKRVLMGSLIVEKVLFIWQI